MSDTSNLFEEIGARISKGKNKKDFNLLYTAIDKADVDEFHRECDGKGPTLTILYGKHNTIFGGYTSKSWSSNDKSIVKEDEDAFLFTINKDGGDKYIFLPVKKKKADMAITCDTRFGPTFGGGTFDLQAFKKPKRHECVYEDGFLKLNGTINVDCCYSQERNPRDNVKGGGNDDQPKIKSKDINLGELIVERIEVYKVVNDELPYMWLQRLEEKEFEHEKQALMEMEPLLERNIKRYNILLVGAIGSGKSSFVNTVATVFSGNVEQIAPARKSEKSVTSLVKPYAPRSKDEESLKVRIFDIRGFEDARGYQHELKPLLDGKLPIEYQFPDKPEVVPDEILQKSTLDDEMHLVCFVNGVFDFDNYTEEIQGHFNGIKDTIAKKGLPMVVVATKFDQLCPKISKDVDHIYKSPKAQKAASEIEEFFGVPLKYVFPVVNYVSETQPNTKKDRLALKALYEMCQLIKTYLQNHKDMKEPSDNWTERERMLPSMNDVNEKDATLKKLQDNLLEYENKKLRVLVIGPTNSGKSSFIDSVSSALQNDIVDKAVGACAASAKQEDVSSTETFELYPMKYKHESGRVTKRNVSFGDTPGFQEKEGITVEHVGYILKGNVPNKYQIINGTQVSNKDFKAHPTPGDKIHCVCVVFDCVSVLKGMSEKIKTTMHNVLQVVSKEEIPFIVILSKCDEVSKMVRRHKHHVFEAKEVKKCKDILIDTFRFKQKNIFPVVNYTQENIVDPNADALLIACFNEVLKIGKNKLDDMEEEERENQHNEA